AEDLRARGPRRGCRACPGERMKPEAGVSALSRGVHDQEPPADLRGRVLRMLDEEWEEAGRPPAMTQRGRDRSPWRAVGAAAVVVLIVGSVAFGATQAHRASAATADAPTYTSPLATLA